MEGPEENLMKKMLIKGDALLPKYENFDFSNLDSTQTKWLDRL